MWHRAPRTGVSHPMAPAQTAQSPLSIKLSQMFSRILRVIFRLSTTRKGSRGEVILHKHHICGFQGRIRSFQSHGDAGICLL